MATGNVEEMFQTFIGTIEKDNEMREEIKKVTKEVEVLCRRAMASLMNVHSRNPDLPAICTQTKEIFPKLRSQFASLKSVLEPHQYFKYRDMWKQHLHQVVYIAAFTQWLENNTLITFKEVNELFVESTEDFAGITIELEDYLIGLSALPNELSRLCVNSVISENYSLPLKVSAFVNELYAGFRLLNLKNDNLRKRYDGIKYDVKKIEEILYDISIRGLDKK